MTDYRKLKKALNRYHKFSFMMPRAGKEFTPQQKAAITRMYRKYGQFIEGVEDDQQSFIPFPKGDRLKAIDGLRTNKGIFYKYPGAKLRRIKVNKKRVTTVSTEFKKIREVFIPFPSSIMVDMDSIQSYVNSQENKFRPDYIMWSVNGFKGRVRYSPELFELYAAELALNPEITEALSDKPFYNGVFFGWEPNIK